MFGSIQLVCLNQLINKNLVNNMKCSFKDDDIFHPFIFRKNTHMEQFQRFIRYYKHTEFVARLFDLIAKNLC